MELTSGPNFFTSLIRFFGTLLKIEKFSLFSKSIMASGIRLTIDGLLVTSMAERVRNGARDEAVFFSWKGCLSGGSKYSMSSGRRVTGVSLTSNSSLGFWLGDCRSNAHGFNPL